MEGRYEKEPDMGIDIDMEDLKLKDLVRMAEGRHAVTCPDATSEWDKVESRLQNSDSQREDEEKSKDKVIMRRIKLWAFTATAAAAIFAGLFFHVAFKAESTDGSFVAFDYNKAPQQITLVQDEEKPVNLLGKDSITFVKEDSQNVKETPKEQQLSTPRGMDFKVILSDGTEVWLNAESTIKFPSSFIEGERRVEINGEAYFKVTHDKQKPFVVITDGMNIRVLGTEFNIRNYEAEEPCVSLVKGSVSVVNPDNKILECSLKPGQNAWRDEKGTLHVGKADTYSVTQWVDGFFYFEDISLVNLLRELGRWYNFGVVFKEATKTNYRLHFSASRKDGINEALSNISSIVKLDIRIEGHDIVVR